MDFEMSKWIDDWLNELDASLPLPLRLSPPLPLLLSTLLPLLYLLQLHSLLLVDSQKLDPSSIELPLSIFKRCTGAQFCLHPYSMYWVPAQCFCSRLTAIYRALPNSSRSRMGLCKKIYNQYYTGSIPGPCQINYLHFIPLVTNVLPHNTLPLSIINLYEWVHWRLNSDKLVFI